MRLSRQGREEKTILESREKAAFQKIASSLSGGKKSWRTPRLERSGRFNFVHCAQAG